jgi:ribosomal-protein-alanine acetyltransferase
MNSASGFVIRRAGPDDVAALQALDRATGQPKGKSSNDYLDGDGSEIRRLILTMRSAAEIVGFLTARAVTTEWEIENIVIAPAYRKQGLGTRLMETLIQEAGRKGAEVLHLEVRPSNVSAIALYGRVGFRLSGVRKAYYSNPEEDALLFSYSFKNSS